jgi:hypothetical protein
MNTSENKLASRLLYLPLDLREKVLLWLAYRELKPVSELTVIRRHRKNNENNLKIKKVKKWIKDAGLFYTNDGKNLTSGHVSKDKNKAILSAKIIHKFDYQSECQSGILFGFPKGSAEAYAFNRNIKIGEDQITVIWPGLMSYHPYLKDKDWMPYIFYAIRGDRIEKDSEVAKLWAETIRKETPILAKWFEKAENRRRIKEIDPEQTQIILLRRNSQKIKEILKEYSNREKTAKGIFLKAIKEFNENYLSEFQFASICYLLLKQEKSSGKDLRKVLKLGEDFYGSKRHNQKILSENFRQLQIWYNQNKY